MTNLFMLLIVAGKIAGSWGPLPYDMDECLNRQVEFQAALGKHPESKDWRAVCRELPVRPELGEPEPDAAPSTKPIEPEEDSKTEEVDESAPIVPINN